MATNVLLKASVAENILDSIGQGNGGGGSNQPDLTQSASAPSNPVAGDLWLDDSPGVNASAWPLNIFMNNAWVQKADFDPSGQTLAFLSPNSGTNNAVAEQEITSGATPPSAPNEGDVWWQTSGTVLVQHLYLNAAWRLTGASYDTASNKYQPIKLGAGLTLATDGAVQANGATGTGAGTGFAAGDIVISLDDPLPNTMIEMNGGIIANGINLYPGIAARYGWMVQGTSIRLPDFRGFVPRGLDPQGYRDVDVSSRLTRVGDLASGAKVGTYQFGAVGSHEHEVAVNYIMPSAQGNASTGMAMGQYNSVNGPINDGTTKTGSVSHPDNRMANIAVRYCLIAG